MFLKSPICFNLFLLVIKIYCSEFEVFDKDNYSKTLHSFWDNSSINTAPGDGTFYLSAPVRLIDHQLGLLSLSYWNRNNKKAKLLPRLVPKKVGGYPGHPVVCYYCNVFWGTAGHYPSEDSSSCLSINSDCGTENERSSCCEPLVCGYPKGCRDRKYCQQESKCLNLGDDCPGNKPCCEGSCIGGTCELKRCLRYGDSCQSETDCCAGLDCNEGHCTCLTLREECECSCCKGYLCKKTDEAAVDAVSECVQEAQCTPDTVEEVCGKNQACIDNTCRSGCFMIGEYCDGNTPCCQAGTCYNGVCKKQCIPDHRKCSGNIKCCSADGCIRGSCGKPKCSKTGQKCTHPCCSGGECVSGVCACRKKGQSCKHEGDCCSGVGHCDRGKCRNCIRLGSGGECKKDLDCCENLKCGEHFAGVCNRRKENCNGHGETCTDSGTCCPGLKCVDNGPGSVGYYCSY